jgi:DHA2 family multidrug resistance protein
MSSDTLSPAADAHGIASPVPSSLLRPLVGLTGIFIAAMMAGLNNRVGALALTDVRGALGFGLDSASWISTAYSAGALIAMPFSAWFGITLSIRRFVLWMLGFSTVVAIILPFIHSLDLLVTLRFLQGIASGAMIPLLMMAALKILPLSIRLHGLALYAMTATFAPNLAFWLAGQWTDELFDWRWVYWQLVPLAITSGLLVGWGMPREPIHSAAFRQANWVGMACGGLALGLITVALSQGVRLDWFHSHLIITTLMAGLALLVVYLLTEWYHPSPFMKLQILQRRNLAVGFTVFLFLLVSLMSSSLLPASYLGHIQGYRPLQMAPIGLTVALPQLVLGPLVAVVLYQKWADARIMLAGGLLLVALACISGAQLTAAWNRDQFFAVQALQALGQPMAVVSMLFLCTSVVEPREGPYVSGIINTLRALGLLIGPAAVGQLLAVRGRFHNEMLLNHAALADNVFSQTSGPSQLMHFISQQSAVLSIADAYRVLGILALLLIPLALRMTYIPAPDLRAASPRHSVSTS